MVRAQVSVALDGVASGKLPTVVATPRALCRRLPTREDYLRAVITINPGEDHPIEVLVTPLTRYGFRRTDLVYEVGDFAVRGGIVDLFPPGEETPIRLDLFGDTVESIRWFDPQSQRSEDTLDAVRLLPLALFPAGADEARLLADRLSGGQAADPDWGPEAAELLEGLRTRGEFPGWENYLPLLADRTISLPEVLGQPLVFAVDPPALEGEVVHHAERLETDFTARREHGRLAVPPEMMEEPAERVREALETGGLRLRDLIMGGVVGGGRDGEGKGADFHG